MAGIEISNLRKTYAGGVEAMKGIDLKIQDGEMVVLVGPSGCGKSTLLRMIAGLETVSSGEIRIGDRVVNELEPAERDIALVFQNYALYPHMTVRGNLEYGLKNRRTPRAEIDARVADAAKLLEIEKFLDRKPRALSGGQRQRVAMGRAIVRQPKVFLFDEPLSNLDAKLRGHMRVEIRRLQRRLGTTSVYVTHDQLEAMTMADRLVVMSNGGIEQVGTPLEVYARPASLHVASFIGAPGMNLIPIDDLRAVAALPDSLPFNTGTLGIRPEEIRLDPVTGPALTLTGQVDAVELVGAESFAYVHVSGLKQELILRHSGASTAQPGQQVTFSLPFAAMTAFDRETGKRID
ncbi:sn-glycerol-3-phosphate import ATP-binding protein UgpC [Ketogulonicigenium vulgare]|uniref:Disease resistance protein:ATP/GTP-binding site motif A (P-loop):ABC transporter:AAA ATPase n=1 Tax=Ketogulonicigenium vulgare (strain WSH-001) TaxID=759362 RepID=F9Y5S6_KETVW|nr:sn-glycerol-3-phosphate import ATP-binding protein UgpC [Ketogulonicigenium vulgare]ADO43738.1 ATP-binding protein, ABC-type glycerol-3-phosphate transporter [Ketogulonicigenium vulgare Y25]AEM42001.1 Disease resistance protein:ATP/GTP-binding site motif A (P-loop):ABC transporter:AAA ATPase [Ketogulonicigenium vulgare WSH-001]ALJ82099.1 glycerol-3-phosphate ABC transporter ATP-binding protein [Ketogulonicigenium vulgare]ANW34724.1 sn-glycerol-3-phosphate ABC transporter ATP-binding protein 